MEIDKSIAISENAMCLKLEKYKSKSSNLISKLDALSPLKTLSRGYSVVENENHKVIK